MNRHDMAKDAPTREQLEEWIDESRLSEFVNTRSPKYKELGLKGKALTKKQAIDLMMKEPNLIRRPVLVRGKRVVFGFDTEQYDEVMKA